MSLVSIKGQWKGTMPSYRDFVDNCWNDPDLGVVLLERFYGILGSALRRPEMMIG